MPTARVAPGEVRWAGDDALGRWSLVAGADRAPWDAVEPDPALRLPVPATQARHALLADATSGRVAFDAQRALFGQRFDARFFATRAALALREDGSAPVASLDERAGSRLQRTRFGLSAALSAHGRMAGLSWERTVAMRVAGESFESRVALGDSWSGAMRDVRRDASGEARVGLEARQRWSLGPTISLTAAARLERDRTRAGALDVPLAASDAVQTAPSLSAAWSPARGFSLFANARRGAEDAARPLLAFDPWHADRPAIRDPEGSRDFLEFGARLGRGAWESRIAAWHTRAPGELAFGEAAALRTPRTAQRHGVGLGLRYAPVSWIDANADLFLDASRDADGPALPGAARVFGSAGATFRMSRDLDAKLSVSYLGPRDNVDEGAALPGSTLANFQLVRWFGRTTRLSLDVFNVFNQRALAVDSLVASRAGLLDGTGEKFLTSPADPRGFLLKLRTRF